MDFKKRLHIIRKRDKLNEALREAIAERDEAEIMKLLAQGLDVNAKGGEDSDTPLHIQAELGRNFGEGVEIIQLFIECGASITQQDRFGRTPAIIAAENQNYDLLQYLVTSKDDYKEIADYLSREANVKSEEWESDYENVWQDPIRLEILNGNTDKVEKLLREFEEEKETS